MAAGLLQATSLPFIVTASMIGVDIGALTPATGSAFVAAGLLSAVLFPVISLSLLRPDDDEPDTVAGGHRGVTRCDVRGLEEVTGRRRIPLLRDRPRAVTHGTGRVGPGPCR